MEEIKITTGVKIYAHGELPEAYRALIESAKEASSAAYAPYSRFSVGAALLLDNGQIINGSNQENAAYPSGLCAERVALFYANARHPHSAPVALAIAAQTGGAFTGSPVTPCGACRQVLLEAENRYRKNITLLFYGEKQTYIIDSTKELLPLSFAQDTLLAPQQHKKH